MDPILHVQTLRQRRAIRKRLVVIQKYRHLIALLAGGRNANPCAGIPVAGDYSIQGEIA